MNLLKKRNNYLQSFSYYFAFLSFGMVISSLGPSIPSLVFNTKTTIGKISFLFTTYNLGILIGSLIGGFLFDYFRGHIVLGSSLIFVSILYCLVPLISFYLYLIGLTFFLGVFLGIILVGGNTLIVWVNKDRVDMWINGLHMFSGIGAFISPLLISLLLNKTGSLKLSYIIISIYTFLSSIFILFLKSPEIRKIKKHESERKKILGPLILISLMFLLYVGAESSFGGWIYVYTLNKYSSHLLISGLITSIFWGMLIIGRFINMFLSSKFKIKVEKTLLLAFSGSVLVILFLNLQNLNLFIYIVFVMLAGLLMATIFPSIMAYAEKIIGITGKINSIFFISTSIGAMVVPSIIGNSYEIYGEKAVMSIIFISLLSSFIVLIFILKLNRTNYQIKKNFNKND